MRIYNISCLISIGLGFPGKLWVSSTQSAPWRSPRPWQNHVYVAPVVKCLKLSIVYTVYLYQHLKIIKKQLLADHDTHMIKRYVLYDDQCIAIYLDNGTALWSGVLRLINTDNTGLVRVSTCQVQFLPVRVFTKSLAPIYSIYKTTLIRC